MSESKNNIIIDIMEEQAAIEDKAWQMFKEAYQREVPPPILEDKPEHQNGWIYYVMLAGLVGALIVSGLQTVPAFYVVMVEAGLPIGIAGIGGVSAFVAVDLVMFSAAHYLVQTRWRLRTKTNEENFRDIERFIQIAQWFGFAVSIGSNFYFVFFAYHVNNYISGMDTGITLAVAILIALAPAIQGLAIGSVIAALPITQEIEEIRINRRNRELMADYNNSMRSSWNSRKSRYGVKDMSERIERLQDAQSVPVQAFMNVHEHHEIPKKRTPARQAVHDYLDEHPNHVQIPVRDFADKLGISMGLASEERRNWQNEQNED